MSKLVIYLFGFSIPFYTFGIQLIDQIYISFPLLAFYIFTIFFILSGRFSQKILFLIVLLNLYIFAITIIRVPLLEFIFAFSAFFISTLALSINFERNPVLYQSFIKGFISAAWVTIILILLSFLIRLILNESQIYLLEPLGYKANYGAGFFGLSRPTIFFIEPAHLSMYLVCVFVVTSFSVTNSYNKNVLNKLSFIAIMITGSLAGAVILVAFLITKRRGFLKHFLTIFYTIILISIMYIFFQDSEIFSRLYRAFTTFSSHNYGGSEGQRVGSIRVIYDSIKDGNIIITLFGTGFSDYTAYFANLYSDSITGSAFKYGKIANSIVLYFVSVGMTGFLLTVYVYGVIFRSNNIRLEYLVVILLFMFVYGTFINYLLWVLIIALMKINTLTVSKYMDPLYDPQAKNR
jgi:hypothetical protein